MTYLERWKRDLLGIADLDDVTHCPQASQCHNCGGTNRLDTIMTFGTPIGVFCATMCTLCALDPDLAEITSFSLSIPDVMVRVMNHCSHLGITLDDMATALDAERPE
ncbi:hypothetical protein DMH04_50095 [Kibdelosporangium aridum]|uniref:Uncharacterized protein n=1 Tax=Kibdelosporangium aridum TaxID=2030 RepID=A0A428YC04_KIBAR|nr:hypothetical protein [Kibdelosporangium aridum]RSM65010.1 hypothetical protein DMH04_50095 [Kibdelosporangium aridum]